MTRETNLENVVTRPTSLPDRKAGYARSQGSNVKIESESFSIMDAEFGHKAYVLGHSVDELERLERQAEFFEEETEDTLKRAGLRPGMRVLDLGCGAGDVALAAAKIVGSAGYVTGVDTSRDAIGTANRRMTASGLTWVQCVEGNIFNLDVGTFDAVIGRFILMHLPAPANLLRQLRRSLKPAGIIAFIEMDISSTSITPLMPLFDRCMRAVIELYKKAGMEPDMGSLLYSTFRQAGLEPSLRGSCRVEGGPHAKVYDYLARTMRSLLPSMQAQGMDVEDIDIDTLACRLFKEAAKLDYFAAYPRLIGAWSQV